MCDKSSGHWDGADATGITYANLGGHVTDLQWKMHPGCGPGTKSETCRLERMHRSYVVFDSTADSKNHHFVTEATSFTGSSVMIAIHCYRKATGKA